MLQHFNLLITILFFDRKEKEFGDKPYILEFIPREPFYGRSYPNSYFPNVKKLARNFQAIDWLIEDN